jgi:hypothetical protein
MEKQPFGADRPVKVSVPRSHSAHPTDTVPDEGMKRLRRVVEVMLPEFAQREFVQSYMCWCTGKCPVGEKASSNRCPQIPPTQNGCSASIRNTPACSSRQATTDTASRYSHRRVHKSSTCSRARCRRSACASWHGDPGKAILGILAEAVRIRWIWGSCRAGRMGMMSVRNRQ